MREGCYCYNLFFSHHKHEKGSFPFAAQARRKKRACVTGLWLACHAKVVKGEHQELDRISSISGPIWWLTFWTGQIITGSSRRACHWESIYRTNQTKRSSFHEWQVHHQANIKTTNTQKDWAIAFWRRAACVARKSFTVKHELVVTTLAWTSLHLMCAQSG